MNNNYISHSSFHTHNTIGLQNIHKPNNRNLRVNSYALKNNYSLTTKDSKKISVFRTSSNKKNFYKTINNNTIVQRAERTQYVPSYISKPITQRNKNYPIKQWNTQKINSHIQNTLVQSATKNLSQIKIHTPKKYNVESKQTRHTYEPQKTVHNKYALYPNTYTIQQYTKHDKKKSSLFKKIISYTQSLSYLKTKLLPLWHRILHIMQQRNYLDNLYCIQIGIFFIFMLLFTTFTPIDTIPQLFGVKTNNLIADAIKKNYTVDNIFNTINDHTYENSMGGQEIIAPQLSYTKYVIKPKDSFWNIAQKHNITDATLISVNNYPEVKRLQPGDVIQIPNINGLRHVVENGDSVNSLAENYGILPYVILDANNLSSSTLKVGQILFLPGAEMTNQAYRDAIGESFIWPLSSRYLSSGFGMRRDPITGRYRSHGGIDIPAPRGTPIVAARDGYIVKAGFNSVYGNHVIISHNQGMRTLYAHLQQIYVRAGTSISQGAQIGLIGSTGYSTGPHLHFEIQRNNHPINPLRYLPS